MCLAFCIGQKKLEKNYSDGEIIFTIGYQKFYETNE